VRSTRAAHTSFLRLGRGGKVASLPVAPFMAGRAGFPEHPATIAHNLKAISSLRFSIFGFQGTLLSHVRPGFRHGDIVIERKSAVHKKDTPIVKF